MMKKSLLSFVLPATLVLLLVFFYIKFININYKNDLVNVTRDALGYIKKIKTSKASASKLMTLDINTEKEYIRVKNSLNIKRPGFGKSDYGNHDIVDIPKAYAMFLSAELMKYQSLNGNYDLKMATNAGQWLLKNSDLNNNGIVGWGVPIAWDAFGDNSINEKNAEYTIATGIVLNSLMDWMELAPKKAPHKKIHSILRQAIKPYLDNDIFSSTGLFNYSLKLVDRKYNCFNPAVYIAGQMQRYSMFARNKEFKNKIKKSVDKVMRAAIKYKKVDARGGWYWSYSVEEDNVPNDLAHAGYVIDGIMTYINHAGTLKEQFDKKAILKHLEYFYDKNGSVWYFHPSFYKNKKLSPRLYGLGMILYIYSKYIKDKQITSSLLKYTQNYKLPNSLYSRWQNEDLVITEYLTYLMYGITSSDYYREDCKKIIYFKNDDKHKQIVENLYKNTTIEKKMSIPLTNFQSKDIEVLFNTETYKTELITHNGKIVLDKYKAVPVKLLTVKKSIIMILRELLTNHLFFVNIDKTNNSLSYKKIDTTENIFLGFREAIIFNNQLVLIAYESHKGQNTLLSYSLDNNSFAKQIELKLPSVEDPAGSTYEVIPKMMLKIGLDSNRLYIISGRLFAEFDGKNLHQIDVDDDIKVFLEAIVTNTNEVFTLYRDQSNNYKIMNMTQETNYFTAKNAEVIFNIYKDQNVVKFKKLDSSDDLKDLFISDFLSNKGSGTLYLGSNNLEGWVAWSQVYYLNGMLSFLELAKNDMDFFKVMKKYVPQIKQRMDLEFMLFMYQMDSSDGLKCRVFTIDRSLATFAVQSSRFVMLLDRYLKLFPNKRIQRKYELYKKNVLSLKDHMETLEKGTSNIVSSKWNPNNQYYLKWSKGNKFYFDGLPVPYNHQNEWATFILKTVKEKEHLDVAGSIVQLFIDNIIDNNGDLPKNAVWPYWWGKAWDGWTWLEDVSANKKSYTGDEGVGWISFRTIDAISILSMHNKENYINNKYIDTISEYISKGYLYPFASKNLISLSNIPLLQTQITSEYIRFSSPWELDNAVWSYFSFIKRESR